MYRSGPDLHKERLVTWWCVVRGGGGGGGVGVWAIMTRWYKEKNQRASPKKKNSKSTDIKKSIKELDLLDHYWILIWLSLAISNTVLFLNDLF